MGDPDMANGRVTMAVLSTKLDSVSQKIDELCREYNVDHDKVAINTQRLVTLEMLVGKPTGPCPLHGSVVTDITDLRITIARMGTMNGMAGGGVVAAVATALVAVGKALGWF